MPVPSIGNVLTPAGFALLSAQAQVALSWFPTPFASIYYINRSLDGVTFTNIASTSNQTYSDTSGVTGTIYTYQVQAGNGTASSLPTPSLQGLSLQPGQTTLGNLRLSAQQRCSKENSQFYTTQEWNSMLDQSFRELYDILIQKFGNDYFVASSTFTTDGASLLYPLPGAFYKLLGVDVALNANNVNSFITLHKFEFAQRNAWSQPSSITSSGMVTNLRYRLVGSNVEILPMAGPGQTIRLWYVPRPNQLINDTDIVDGVSGWEEYIILDAVIKALAKEESDVSIFAAQKMAIMKRIEEAAENRDAGEPQKVTDVLSRNGAFGSGQGWGQ